MNRLPAALCRTVLGLVAATTLCTHALAADGTITIAGTAGTTSATGPSGATAALTTATASAVPVRRSLTARLRTTEVVLFTGQPPCFAYGTVQGSGQSNVLGRITMNATDCVNPEGGFTPGGLNTFSFASLPGTLVFTTANGERVFASYSGTISATGKLRGHFVIVGGTGQYFAATGGGTLSGQQDLSQIVTTQGVVDAEGEISY